MWVITSTRRLDSGQARCRYYNRVPAGAMAGEPGDRDHLEKDGVGKVSRQTVQGKATHVAHGVVG